MRCLILSFLIVFFCNSSFSQDTITIFFGPEYYTEEDMKISFGYELPRTYYGNRIDFRGEYYPIKLPDNFIASDTAWVVVYFTGWKNPAINNVTPILLGNYKSKKPIVYVDYNNNLDFSDDGAPLQFNMDSSTVVYFRNSEVDNAYFPIKFWMMNPLQINYEPITNFFGKPGPRKMGGAVVDWNFWLCNERMNNKITYTNLNGTPLLIGLHDYDCNGLFNDKRKDRIMIGDYASGKITWDYKEGAHDYTGFTLLPIDSLVYEVIDIEQTGKYIKIKQTNKPYIKPLGRMDKLTNFEIYHLDYKSDSLKNIIQENKWVLLDFWTTWCKACTFNLETLKKLQQNRDNLQIIGVNCEGKDKLVQKYIDQHKITWINVFASEELVERLRIDSYPTYILLDKRGSIVLIDNINKIESYLDERNKK